MSTFVSASINRHIYPIHLSLRFYDFTDAIRSGNSCIVDIEINACSPSFLDLQIHLFDIP